MSRIKPDERVVFFPMAARLSDDGRLWIVPIHGWIFEPEVGDWWRAPLVRKLREMVDLPKGEQSPTIFEERVRLFLVDNERGKRIGIRIAGTEQLLSPSAPGGHFTGEVTLPADVEKRSAAGGQIRFEAITDAGDLRTFTGVTYCLPPEGISVVSDIDDTIKISDVRNRKELMRNTFLREFRAVDGMASLYDRWEKAGAGFHYVSSSPWQLYEPLAKFLNASGFPNGTFHLKSFRAKDSTALDLFADPMSHKFAVIEQLVKEFPKRTFVLVGDSAERDPEIYGRLAREYPAQVERIYIRNVTDEPTNARRYSESFQDVPAAKWRIFKDPADLSLPEKAASR
jgi:phosphatidate phosphatase APP1